MLDQVEECERCGEDEQQRPEGQERVSALVSVVVDEQRAERVDEGRNQQGEGDDFRPSDFGESGA